ncbi:kinase-like domain-containing protein [Abortiporus biennis]|nr:kinase-like domain-containing protein [Abortiporus biennis]
MYPPFRIRDTWQCETMIGRGSFAWVWNVFDIHSGAGTAIKWELIHSMNPETIPYESAVYAQVHGYHGIVHMHWSGREINTNVLVMDRLGPNLEVLRRFCRGSFSLKTVLMLGEQMLATIDQVHSREIIVHDIKPENFALGQVEDYKQLFLFDLGLSKLFLDPTTGKHMPFHEGRGGIGTLRYASHNMHFGLDYSPFSKLLQNSPTFFQKFFDHCRSLEFESKPDYTYLRKLLRNAMAENKWEYDWKYDWWDSTEQGTLMPEEYKLYLCLVQPVRHKQNVL